MPFRRLPATDSSRSDALRAVYTKSISAPVEELPFSTIYLDKIKIFYPKFKKEIEERGTALSVQSEATLISNAAQEKCRMYVSHYIQVFNFGVARNKFKASERAFFQLSVNQETVPDLKSADSLTAVAENIIKGDVNRIAAGGAEMSNPSTAEVEAVYNDYAAKSADQSAKKGVYEKEQKDVDNIRAEADELIADIWDEIEFKYRKDEPSAMRRKAREYGVVYVSRPGEPVEESAQPAPEVPAK